MSEEKREKEGDVLRSALLRITSLGVGILGEIWHSTLYKVAVLGKAQTVELFFKTTDLKKNCLF